jgi:acetate kinase
MKILVSNIGSSSFKFRLFEMSAEREAETAAGDADRIGAKGGVLKLRIGDSPWRSQPRDFADHGAAIQAVLDALVAGGALSSPKDLGAVAFKAVMAGDVEPVVLVDQKLLARMEYFIPVAPPTTRPTSPRCGCSARSWATRPWWPRSRRASTARSPSGGGSTPSRRNGRKSTA